MFFNSSISNTFIWCINQFLLLNTSSFTAPLLNGKLHFFVQCFHFPHIFLLIHSVSFSFDILNLEFDGNFHLVSEFLAISFPFYGCCECWQPCVRLSLYWQLPVDSRFKMLKEKEIELIRKKV